MDCDLPFSIHLGVWDFVLIGAVSVQCVIIAYLRQPQWKALVGCLPIPFTLASLALGKPVGAMHAAGMPLALAYTYSVWLLHRRAHMPIIPAIAVSALGYCIAAAALSMAIPRTAAAFWIAVAMSFGIALGLHITMPHQAEPGHRSPLPLWRKLPIIVAVLAFVVIAKQPLQGFITMFPMVGVIICYEARHSLWTLCRYYPVIIMAFIAMMITVWFTQNTLGPGTGLLVGWLAYLAVLIPLAWKMRAQANNPCSMAQKQENSK